MSNNKYENVSPEQLQAIQKAVDEAFTNIPNSNVDDAWDYDVLELDPYSSLLIEHDDELSR